MSGKGCVNQALALHMDSFTTTVTEFPILRVWTSFEKLLSFPRDAGAIDKLRLPEPFISGTSKAAPCRKVRIVDRPRLRFQWRSIIYFGAAGGHKRPNPEWNRIRR
jgi:hypothetical protein